MFRLEVAVCPFFQKVGGNVNMFVYSPEYYPSDQLQQAGGRYL